MTKRLRRAAALFIVLAAPASAAPATSPAQLPDSVSVSQDPATLIYPQNASVSWRIQMTAGAQPIAIGMYIFGPSWPGDRQFEGAPLRFGEPSITSPGQIRRPRRFFTGDLAYGIIGACQRGESRGRRGDQDAREIHVPAGETVVLTIPAHLNSAPWPSIDYTPGFTVFALQADGDPIFPDARLAVPRPVFGGVSGVHLSIRAKKSRSTSIFGGRRPPQLTGSTVPAVPSRRVRLKAVRLAGKSYLGSVGLSDWGRKASRKLGSAVTRANGTFRIKRPKRLPPGTYRVLARYDDAPPGLVADWNCGPLIRIADASERKRAADGGG